MTTANGKPEMSREQFLGHVDEIIHNAMLSSRSAAWMDQSDRRRHIDEECDYPPTGIPVGVDYYKELYEREPVAARVVEVMPRSTWQAVPRILDNAGDGQTPTEFEDAIQKLGEALAVGGGPSWHREVHGSPLWEKLLRLDILSGIGQFGVMLLGLDDGLNLQDPVEGSTTLLTNSAGTTFAVPDSPIPLEEDLHFGGTALLRQLAEGPGKRPMWTHNEKVGKEFVPQFKDVVVSALNSTEKAFLAAWEDQRRVYDSMARVRAGGTKDEHVAKWEGLHATVANAAEQQRDERGRWVAMSEAATTATQRANSEQESFPGRLAEELGDLARESGTLATGHMRQDEHIDAMRQHFIAADAHDKLRQKFDQDVHTRDVRRHEIARDAHLKIAKAIHAETGGGTGVRNKFVEKFADLLPGTDRQYYEAGSLGMGMAQAKGASLQGTDQQYMGIQFGPSEAPAPKPAKQKRKLLFVRCFDESLVQVVRWEWNVNNPRFGQPVMYRVTLNDPRQIYSGVGLPMATVFVHWTRIIHVACIDYKQSSEVLGTPRMQQCLNRLIDIRKESAAAGEGYWQSCFAMISLETNPALGGDVKLDYAGLDQMMADVRSRLRRDIITAGLTAKTLPPSVVDPGPYISVCIDQVCIRIACPIRVFKGSERGELASSQDDAQWNDVLRAREQFHTTPGIICPFFDRLILLNVLPEPKEGYRVDWPDRDTLNDKDKAALALTIVQALAAYIAGNVASVIHIKAFLLKAFDGYFSQEEIDTIVDEAEKHAEKDLEEKQAIADEHGFQPAPPKGFQPIPEEPAPVPTPSVKNEYDEAREAARRLLDG